MLNLIDRFPTQKILIVRVEGSIQEGNDRDQSEHAKYFEG